MKKIDPHLKIRHLVIIFFLVLGTSSHAFSSQTSLGMAIQVSGSVSYHNKLTGSGGALGPFMKLYTGDTLSLEADSLVQIVLFANGRRETWQGPMEIVIDKEKVYAVNKNGTAAAVHSLPQSVTREVRRLTQIADASRMQTAGAKVVRGITIDDQVKQPLKPVILNTGEKDEIDIYRETYRSLLKEAARDDITPELYLFSVLADYDQYDEMGGLIKTMKTKQPGNSSIKLLEKWMEDQM